MKNITLSADEELIERARAIAAARGTTLNQEFRDWLAEYANGTDRAERAERAMTLIKDLQATYSTGGRKFTREEMNERR